MALTFSPPPRGERFIYPSVQRRTLALCGGYEFTAGVLHEVERTLSDWCVVERETLVLHQRPFHVAITPLPPAGEPQSRAPQRAGLTARYYYTKQLSIYFEGSVK